MTSTYDLTDLADALEIDRARDELYNREAVLKMQQNGSIVELGQQAVFDGAINRGNVLRITKATIARHLGLISRMGVEVEDRHKSAVEVGYRVGTRVVEVAPEIGLSVWQSTRSPIDSAGFWKMRAEQGIEPTLGYYAEPSNTFVFAHDLNREEAVFQTIALGPNSWNDPEESFRQEWGPHLLPFSKLLTSEHEAASSQQLGLPPEPQELTEKELVIAAGFNLQFNGLLDVIQAGIV
jgi:hypothetical protein